MLLVKASSARIAVDYALGDEDTTAQSTSWWQCLTRERRRSWWHPGSAARKVSLELRETRARTMPMCKIVPWPQYGSGRPPGGLPDSLTMCCATRTHRQA